MNRFQSLFFASYVSPDEEIQHVFHRHFLIVIEDMILWMLFGLAVPGFIYFLNIFHIQMLVSLWHVYLYIFVIYFVLIYKIFDWYCDVWILTDHSLIDLRWKWFSSNFIIVAFDKIEGIEVRTYSRIYSMMGISDIVAKLMGEDTVILKNAARPTTLVHTLQEAIKPHKKEKKEEDKEPFDILVDTLSDVVKGHLVTGGKNYITRDYVEKLDDTLTQGESIDLRTKEEKIIIEEWKERYQKDAPQDEGDEHSKTHP